MDLKPLPEKWPEKWPAHWLPKAPSEAFLKNPDWAPFRIAAPGDYAEAPRSINSPEGRGDRMRAAAFAELQAMFAFAWAAEHFRTDASPELVRFWERLVIEEERHLKWILTRMHELKVQIGERLVTDLLWTTLMKCKTAKEFGVTVAEAEERGRKAALRFGESLITTDPGTAEIFKRIADEEIEHVSTNFKA